MEPTTVSALEMSGKPHFSKWKRKTRGGVIDLLQSAKTTWYSSCKLFDVIVCCLLVEVGGLASVDLAPVVPSEFARCCFPYTKSMGRKDSSVVAVKINQVGSNWNRLRGVSPESIVLQARLPA